MFRIASLRRRFVIMGAQDDSCDFLETSKFGERLHAGDEAGVVPVWCRFSRAYGGTR
jgi:hypothetical protein